MAASLVFRRFRLVLVVPKRSVGANRTGNASLRRHDSCRVGRIGPVLDVSHSPSSRRKKLKSDSTIVDSGGSASELPRSFPFVPWVSSGAGSPPHIGWDGEVRSEPLASLIR